MVAYFVLVAYGATAAPETAPDTSFKRTVDAALLAAVIPLAPSAMPAIIRILRLPARSDHEADYTYAMEFPQALSRHPR